MKYILHILITGIVAGMFSCESLITTVPDSKLPKGTEKVVLHAYISPQDTLILVKLTLSNPLLGVYRNNGYGYVVVGQDTIFFTGGVVEDASVILSDSKKQSVSIPYIKTEGLYMLSTRQFQIVAGETYTITAETHKGKVEATCIVPKENTPITSYAIDTLSEEFFNEPRKVFRINFEWKDTPGQINYYTMKASVKSKMHLWRNNSSWPPEPIDQIITYTGYWDEENRQEQYQTDINRDGTLFLTPNGIIELGTEAIFQNGTRYSVTFAGGKSIITLEVLNTEKNYYDYHRAVRINNRQDGNPFVEPVPIPTNVKNGLGCFAASNKSILTVVY